MHLLLKIIMASRLTEVGHGPIPYSLDLGTVKETRNIEILGGKFNGVAFMDP